LGRVGSGRAGSEISAEQTTEPRRGKNMMDGLQPPHKEAGRLRHPSLLWSYVCTLFDSVYTFSAFFRYLFVCSVFPRSWFRTFVHTFSVLLDISGCLSVPLMVLFFGIFLGIPVSYFSDTSDFLQELWGLDGTGHHQRMRKMKSCTVC